MQSIIDRSLKIRVSIDSETIIAEPFDELVKISIRRQSKKLQIQGAQIPRNEAY